MEFWESWGRENFENFYWTHACPNNENEALDLSIQIQRILFFHLTSAYLSIHKCTYTYIHKTLSSLKYRIMFLHINILFHNHSKPRPKKISLKGLKIQPPSRIWLWRSIFSFWRGLGVIWCTASVYKHERFQTDSTLHLSFCLLLFLAEVDHTNTQLTQIYTLTW